MPWRFYREKVSAVSPLVDTRRVVPTHALLEALPTVGVILKHTTVTPYGDSNPRRQP